MEGKLKVHETNQKSEKKYTYSSHTFIAMSFRGNVHVWLGCTKSQSPGINTVLHWRPPNVHIFGSYPSLVNRNIVGGNIIVTFCCLWNDVTSQSVLNVSCICGYKLWVTTSHCLKFVHKSNRELSASSRFFTSLPFNHLTLHELSNIIVIKSNFGNQ